MTMTPRPAELHQQEQIEAIERALDQSSPRSRRSIVRKAKPVRHEFYVNHNRRYVDEARGVAFREEHLDGPFRSEDRAWKSCVRRRKHGFEAFIGTYTRWPEDKSPRFNGGRLLAVGTTPDAA